MKYNSQKSNKKGVRKSFKGKSRTETNKKRNGHKKNQNDEKGETGGKESGYVKMNGLNYHKEGRKRKGFKTDKGYSSRGSSGKGEMKKYEAENEQLKEAAAKEADKLKMETNHGMHSNNFRDSNQKLREYDSNVMRGSNVVRSPYMVRSGNLVRVPTNGVRRMSNKFGLRRNNLRTNENGKRREQKLHKRGVKTTGYHNVFHKDEYKKEHTFYDDLDHHGDFKLHGNQVETIESKKNRLQSTV